MKILLSHGKMGRSKHENHKALMNLNDQLKSKILRDFDKKLQTELSTDLYSFIATVKLDEGDSFHDVVDVIFDRDGARGLKDFLGSLIAIIADFETQNPKN
jgi:hypothetical protein